MLDCGGVYLSTHAGTNWMSVSPGLSNTNIRCFAIQGANVFAGTYGGGLWQRPLSEIIPGGTPTPSPTPSAPPMITPTPGATATVTPAATPIVTPSPTFTPLPLLHQLRYPHLHRHQVQALRLVPPRGLSPLRALDPRYASVRHRRIKEQSNDSQ